MRPGKKILLMLSFTAIMGVQAAGFAQARPPVLDQKPDAVIDLMTDEGVRLVKGQWRYSDARIVDVEHRQPGPDLGPSGPPSRTQDLLPHAGVAGFDDGGWMTIEAPGLEARRASGRLCFNWYRIKVTIPERIGAFDPTGATLVFEIVVDDYAEVWVDGRLPIVLGQTGGPVIKGFNAPNRVVLTRHAHPGQEVQLAVLGANGPLSQPPGNFIWVRSATLDFYRPSRFSGEKTLNGEIVRLDGSLDAIVPPDARIEKAASGFTFTEGPVWLPATASSDGFLLFSDPNDNRIYRLTQEGEVSVFRTKSGYAGADIGEYHQPGSNGLALDGQGRLTINQHGNRRVIRVEPHGNITVLADRYEGKRLNSPNDLVYRSDGSLYFTDPPFGLPKTFDDPRKELPYSGVYRVANGSLQLLATELSGPNGIAFSPDEGVLYVGNWDEKRKVVMRYELRDDGSLAEGRVFADLTREPGEEAIDGVKVDRAGNVYVCGPGAVWIFSPEGKRLGLIRTEEAPHNLAWGGDDARTLYITAQSSIYTITLNIPGARS